MIDDNVSDYDSIPVQLPPEDTAQRGLLNSSLTASLASLLDQTESIRKKFFWRAIFWLFGSAVLLGIVAFLSFCAFKNIDIARWRHEILFHFLKEFPLIIGVWVSLSQFSRSRFLEEYYTHLRLGLILLPSLSLDLSEEDKSRVIEGFIEKCSALPETKNKKCSNKTIDSSLTLIEKLIDKIPTPK